MREGMNPASENPQLEGFLRHRVIIPVYIPTMTGYFESAAEILRMCLESLRLTIGGGASVTIISNGSAREVVAELERMYEEGWIDQLLLNRRNWGKVDAVMSVARGAYEELVTISDCDVLFRPGWVEAIGSIFYNFPECGIASPVPRPMAAWSHTSATVLGSLMRRELAFEKIVPDIDIDRFAVSIGRADMFRDYRKAQMIVRRNGVTACVGSGHMVPTLRKDAIMKLPRCPSLLAYKAERRSIDLPLDQHAHWRLSTTRAYAYHMGNRIEPWMYDELEQCRQSAASADGATAGAGSLPAARRHLVSRIPLSVRTKLMTAVRKSIPLVCRIKPGLRERCPGGVTPAGRAGN